MMRTWENFAPKMNKVYFWVIHKESRLIDYNKALVKIVESVNIKLDEARHQKC